MYIQPLAAMNAAPDRQGDLSPSHISPLAPELSGELSCSLWRGSELGTAITAVVSTGWAELDEELPGGGWPCHALTEILQAQPSVCEWRLLGPALRRIVEGDQTLTIVGPPKQPHLPGLRHVGIDDKHLVWVEAQTPAERLWATEQLIKANACGALLAWLPQARPEQVRRLQVCAQACDGPVILFRPAAAQFEASAAPLRLLVSYGLDWELQVHVHKRRGPRHEGVIHLPSIPGGLDAVLTPRLHTPSRLIRDREVAADVLGSTAPGQTSRRRVSA
jgi:protein ImuA